MSNRTSPHRNGRVFDPDTTVVRSPAVFTVPLDGDAPVVAASPTMFTLAASGPNPTVAKSATMFTVAVGRPSRTVQRSAPRPVPSAEPRPARRVRVAPAAGCGRETRTAMQRRRAATVDWFAAAA